MRRGSSTIQFAEITRSHTLLTTDPLELFARQVLHGFASWTIDPDASDISIAMFNDEGQNAHDGPCKVHMMKVPILAHI